MQLQRQSSTEKGELTSKIQELTEFNRYLARTMDADRDAAEQLRKARIELIGGFESMRELPDAVAARARTRAPQTTADEVSAPLLTESPRGIERAPNRKRSPIAQLAAILDGVSDDDASSIDEHEYRDSDDDLISALLDMEPDIDDDEEDEDEE